MMIVVDASTVAAALIEDSPRGTWALHLVSAHRLAAPHLMPAECANVLRRAELNHSLSREHALLVRADLTSLPVDLYPYAALGDRITELRDTLTTYDAWYVALAEALDVPLATCDLRLVRAPGPTCEFLTPPSAHGS